MTLNQLLADGKLVKHRTSRQEIASLLKVVERDIADASIKTVSSDRRFAIAYNAALQLATIALYLHQLLKTSYLVGTGWRIRRENIRTSLNG
jgi:hypothetical protein